MEVLHPPSTAHSQTPPTFRRSFTTPTRSSASPKSSPSVLPARAEEAETLYAHNAGRIISFNPPLRGARRHSSVEQGHSALQDEPVGTLPWASTTERTIASGPLRIHQVHNSVAFLQSGRIFKPILAKSQCWCVDGESKFALPVGPFTYYRIELPNATPEDRAKVEEFKVVLSKVLQFETTPCPFKRGFTVDLPEKPKTSMRKKPWKPRERPQNAPTAEEPERKPRRWERPQSSSQEISAADEIFEEETERSDEYTDSIPDDSAENSEVGPDSETTDDSDLTPRTTTWPARQDIDPYKTPTRPKTLRTSRATTAPPQLSLHTTPPSNTSHEDLNESDGHEEIVSLSSSVDSFHSFHSPISPLPPSPRFSHLSISPQPDDNEDLTVPKARSHRRDDSELTVTATPEDFWATSEPTALDQAFEPASPDLPQTPTLLSDTNSQSEEPSPEVITPVSAQLHRRTVKSKQRSRSPLPSPANLYSPSRLAGHHLTTALLQKTCSLLLGPPVSLVALMLNIASKIMNGTYHGFALGYAGSSQKIPCSWDFSDTDQTTDEEDDYGFALGKLPSSRSSSRSRGFGGSWEID
ncbi:MAG: hypothetical protein Q9220_004403 [cf. Caloplaca sp. 1 TL-2023]